MRRVCLLQQPGQVAVGIQTVLHGGLDQAERHGTAGGAFGRVGKQEVLPVDDEGLDEALMGTFIWLDIFSK